MRTWADTMVKIEAELEKITGTFDAQMERIDQALMVLRARAAAA